MNKKYLKENNLYEAHKQFMKLCEWSYFDKGKVMNEDDDEDDDNAPMGGNQMPNGNQNSSPMTGGGQGGAPMGGEDSMTGGQGGAPMDGDMPMDGDQGGASMGDEMPIDDEPMEDDESEEDDVIDVDDITNAQEKMNDKVNKVGQNIGDVDDKIEALMKAISNMETMINNNNDAIASFKQEFEKRNPTQTEKLNLRSLDSYPFNVNPKEYWDNKNNNPYSNYEGYSDNDEHTEDEYEITNNDVDDFSEKSIMDSFQIDDDLNQDIKKIFDL